MNDDPTAPSSLTMARCLRGMALVAADREDELRLMLGTVPEAEAFDVIALSLRMLTGWFVETRGEDALAVLEAMATKQLAESDAQTPTTQGRDSNE